MSQGMIKQTGHVKNKKSGLSPDFSYIYNEQFNGYN